MIEIRYYLPQDREAVINACWKNGYMGETAEGRFNDPVLG
jgi:hypothetical protein